MNIERLLQNFLRGKIQTVDKQTILDASFGDSNKTLNVFFALARDEIRNVNDGTNLDRLAEMLSWIQIILNNKTDINHKIVERKVNQLIKLMDTVLEERRKIFTNPDKIDEEFDKVRRKLNHILDNNHTDTKAFLIIHKLIDEIRNLAFIESVLKGVPSMPNVKNKDGVTIIEIALESFLQEANKNNKDSFDYFEKVIILIMSQESFEMTDRIRKDSLDMINRNLQNLRCNKKRAKKMKDILAGIELMQERFKNHGCKEKSVDILADKYKIHVFFSPYLLEETTLCEKPKEGSMSGREIVEDYMVSIDKPGVIEIDDALSCKKLPNGNYLLGVHCASPLGYYSYESDLVQEAIYRNHSIYLPRPYQKKENDYYRTIPIFPYYFSAEKGSLKEGEPRRARSYFFEIDENGNVVSERFPKTVVINCKKLTYKEADDIIMNGSRDKKLEEVMRNLQHVTRILSKKHREDYLYESIKDNTEDDSLLRTKRIGSENIVFRAAFLAGNRVGEFFARNNYPCLYRTLEVDRKIHHDVQVILDEIKKIYGDDKLRKIYQVVESLFPKACFALSGRHDGLNVDHMVQCTSLLRRGGDIVVEHALEVCYDKEPTAEELMELEAEISEKAFKLNSQTSYIDIFVKEYQRQSNVKAS